MSVTYTTVHSNAGSLTHWAESRDWTCILRDTSWVLNPMSHNRDSPFFFLFMGTSITYGSSQTRNRSCSFWPRSQPQQHGIQAASVTYTAACGNAGPLTHGTWAGIEPTSSWKLCQVLNPLSHNGNSTYILSNTCPFMFWEGGFVAAYVRAPSVYEIIS